MTPARHEATNPRQMILAIYDGTRDPNRRTGPTTVYHWDDTTRMLHEACKAYLIAHPEKDEDERVK